MIPAHLRPYPAWESWVDDIGFSLVVGGTLLVSEALSPSTWIHVVSAVAAILVWGRIFHMIRGAIAASKQPKAD